MTGSLAYNLKIKAAPIAQRDNRVKILKMIILCLTLLLHSGPMLCANSASVAVSSATSENKLDLDAIIKKLKEWDLKLNTLQTNFLQEISFKEAELKKTVSGAVYYLKPNYLKIEHISPEKQTIVTDKKTIWISKPSDNQVIKTSWDKWFKIQNGQFSGILDFGNYSKLIEKNDVRLKKTASPRIAIELTPKNNPALYTLTLELSSTDYFPVNAILDLNEIKIITALKAAKKNAPLAKEIFKFTAPKNAETITFGESK